MLEALKRIYFRIGLHTAPEGTLLYHIHKAIEGGYLKAIRSGVVEPWRGSRARVATLRAEPNPAPTDDDKINDDILVAFRITGGIGDHLLAARYIRDLLSAVGDFRFDIYSSQPAEAQWIFSSFSQFNQCFDEYFSWDRNVARYPLAIYVTMFVCVYNESAQWRRLSKENRRLVNICKKIVQFQTDIDFIVDHHPRTDGLLGRKAVYMGRTRKDFAHEMSGIAYGGDRLALQPGAGALEKFGLPNKRYITIHNGFNKIQEHLVGKGKAATKCYPRFDELVTLLRQRFPALPIVQLGTQTSAVIKGADFNLKDLTTLPETAEIIRGSVFHIDVESGLVHLAACLGTKSCVIFGPTDHEFFAYQGNVNVAPSFCGGCWWTSDDWLSNCPRGFAEARCMSEQSPQAVLEAIEAARVIPSVVTEAA